MVNSGLVPDLVSAAPAGDPQNLKEDSRSSKGGPDLGSWTTKRA